MVKEGGKKKTRLRKCVFVLIGATIMALLTVLLFLIIQQKQNSAQSGQPPVTEPIAIDETPAFSEEQLTSFAITAAKSGDSELTLNYLQSIVAQGDITKTIDAIQQVADQTSDNKLKADVLLLRFHAIFAIDDPNTYIELAAADAATAHELASSVETYSALIQLNQYQGNMRQAQIYQNQLNALTANSEPGEGEG